MKCVDWRCNEGTCPGSRNASPPWTHSPWARCFPVKTQSRSCEHLQGDAEILLLRLFTKIPKWQTVVHTD